MKMVNQSVFNSRPTRETDTTNEAGGSAYKMDTKHAIAQYAVTGCFNSTYYADGKDQLDKIKELIKQLPSNPGTVQFLGKLAVYSRHSAFMKDMPAFLVAYLCNMKYRGTLTREDTQVEIYASQSLDKFLIEKVFSKVIDNGKMLRNFVQIMRSGATGRKSLGSFPKRLVKNWITRQGDVKLFRNSIGNDPSLVDVIKMTHVKYPNNAMIKYLLGQDLNEQDAGSLPAEIVHYEAFKQYLQLDADQRKEYGKMDLPKVDFQFLTSLPLEKEHWQALAQKATWHQIRINLNTFHRHKALDNVDLVKELADKLKHPEEIKKAKAMPYQLLAARKNNEVNNVIINDALEDALDISLGNAPVLHGTTHIFVDSSGSMGLSATGGFNSTMTCYDVAALFATGLLKANPNAQMYTCDTTATPVQTYHRDSWLTTVKTIQGGKGAHGGTDTSACIQYLLDNKLEADNIVIISDTQSWAHFRQTPMEVFNAYRKKAPGAKLLCINIQPNDSMQFDYDPAVLHVGGFNDSVFLLAEKFFNTPEAIEQVEV